MVPSLGWLLTITEKPPRVWHLRPMPSCRMRMCWILGSRRRFFPLPFVAGPERCRFSLLKDQHFDKNRLFWTKLEEFGPKYQNLTFLMPNFHKKIDLKEILAQKRNNFDQKPKKIALFIFKMMIFFSDWGFTAIVSTGCDGNWPRHSLFLGSTNGHDEFGVDRQITFQSNSNQS